MSSTSMFKKVILFLLLLISLSGLVVYAAKGLTARYAQDDYCYGYRVKENGFIANQIYSYLEPTEYNGNRYSLTLSNNVVEVFGGVDIFPIVPAILIVLWAAGAVWLLFQVLPDMEAREKLILASVMGCFLVFFAFYLSPKLYQILYWLAAQQSYLMPMIVYTIVFAFSLSIAKQDQLKTLHWVVLGLLTVYAGGGSETTTIWFLAGIGLLTLYSLVQTEGFLSTVKVRKLLCFILGFTFLSTILLAISPTNGQSLRSTPTPVFAALRISFVYGFDFVVNTLKSAPIPYTLLIVFGFFSARLTASEQEKKWSLRLLRIFISVVVVYLLSTVTMFPTMYAMSAYPGPRALISAQISLLVGLVVIGWELERFQRSVLPVLSNHSTLSRLVTGLLGLVLAVYIGRAVVLETQDLSLHRARAEAWDQREEMIINAIAEEQTDIVIPAFDSIYEITELKDNPGHWVNLCAAKYYGVDSLTAVENHNGIGIFPIGK